MNERLVVESAGMTVVCGKNELTITHNMSGKSVVLKVANSRIVIMPHGSTYRLIPYSEKSVDGGMTF